MGSMEKQYGVMLIGCGHIGEQHLADIYYRYNIRITAVVDKDIERASMLAKKYGAAHADDDYHSYLLTADTDIVIIATYADTHLTILEECLRAGKHVLCEKPIANSLEDGRRFSELVKASDCKVLVAHILRHNRSYQTMAKMIHDGAIGELKLMRMVQNHHAKDWSRYQRLLKDCPPVVDCGVHYIDVMQWFSGSRVVEVSGFGGRLDPDVEHDNFGVIHLRLANGCMGSYEAGWSRNLASQNSKEFIGDKGRITLTPREDRATQKEEGDLITLYSSETGEYKTINVDAKYKDMYAQLSALIDMIENDAPASPTMEEVFSAFSVVLTANEAIQKHIQIAIEE